MATYRDIRTGATISQETFNRSISHGGNPDNFSKISDENLTPEAIEIFGKPEDFYYNDADYEEFEELTFDGGANYGEE